MSVTDDTAFIAAFEYVVSAAVEGDLSTDESDPGNWTGGKVGAGEMKGTKCGISAASYPNLDIANLDMPQIRGIYYSDFWLRIRGPDLPAAVGFCAFDSAVNQGPSGACHLLQRALGLHEDGVLGPATIAAVRKFDADMLVEYFQAERVLAYTKSPIWETNKRGWSRRVVLTAMKAARLT